MVAPNGARLSAADHPALPVTQDEIVQCARSCFAAGADGLHAHIRDRSGRHLLDAGAYDSLLSALKDAVPDMAIQITTEAAGIYQPDIQMDIALDSRFDMVSASIREIRRAGREKSSAFYQRCSDADTAVQHILYDISDCELLEDTLDRAALTDPALQLIFVLGRYSEARTSHPEELDPFMVWLKDKNITPDWATCAFGPNESVCLQKAHSLGGKCRVGLENSLFLSDGSLARDNTEKVTDLLAMIEP